LVVSRALAEATVLDDASLGAAIDELVSGIPHGIARLLSGVLWGLADLPVQRPSAEIGVVTVADALPPWLPARRTIGGFYVQRALGVGGTASVFIVTRSDDKHDPQAERFALKVPDYNATAARSLSQDEFLRMFREEASALISLPSHENLARFVTFDMGTKPLPILVMELVEGVTLERVIQSQTLDMKRCLRVLDDMLAGLCAMHSVGVGHLDIKPSNVLLRRGEQAVLVDFGLAGRKIRQGCGTGPYGAPEVWGVLPEGFVASPLAADMYSFGCIAFETLTGKVLFDAPNEVAQIAMHLSHDGYPAPMKALLANPDTSGIAEALLPTLRRDPRRRPSAETVRERLAAAALEVESAKWPVVA
jgi:eukaryotic-like serine/threonine-protein kinase